MDLVSPFIEPSLRDLCYGILGFFGSYVLGITQSPALIPMVCFTGIGLWSAIVKRRCIFIVLLYASTALLVGFTGGRAFAYVQLAGLALITRALSTYQDKSWFPVVCAILVGSQIFTVIPLRTNDLPFKRNLAIPYQSLLVSIEDAVAGRTNVITTDPIVRWQAEHRFGKKACVERPPDMKCSGTNIDTLIFVRGHSNDLFAEDMLKEKVEQARKDYGEPFVSVFGIDQEAQLKRQITGVDLESASSQCMCSKPRRTSSTAG
jgi:hypothetical protein